MNEFIVEKSRNDPAFSYLYLLLIAYLDGPINWLASEVSSEGVELGGGRKRRAGR